MTTPPEPALATPALVKRRQQWRAGWRRYVFPGIWLVYLGQTAHGVSVHSTGAGAVIGYAIIGLFCVCYIVGLPVIWSGQRRLFWTLYLAMYLLCAVETLFAHQDAFVMCVYIAVLTMGGIRRAAIPIIAGLTLATVFIPPLIPSWHTGVYTGMMITIPLVALAMWGFFGIIESNIELAAARSEVARLAAENERTRIARDLHDLLGHSLTTITVKPGLPRRLAERGNPQRSAAEIAEVEELSRRILADVRAAVAGHRDVTLTGELATAREVLRAAGVIAQLPGSVDVVHPSLSELFGWVVREGITNVVRHARASHCTVTLGRDFIEIADDGRGGAADAGSGLTGLRERV